MSNRDPALSTYNQPGERKCLRCGKLFESDGPWNRLCEDCNRTNKLAINRAGKAPTHQSKGRSLDNE